MKRLGAGLIVLLAFRVVMLAAVGFDSQARGKAAKINDVAGDRDLPAKVKAAYLTAAKRGPKPFLRVCRRFAHLPGEPE